MPYNLTIDIILILLSISTFITPIYQTYLYNIGRKFRNISNTYEDKYIILLPVKKEPIEIIINFFKNNRELVNRSILTILIADEYSNEELNMIISRLCKLNVENILIIPSRKSINKAYALNRALDIIKNGDFTIVVFDIDSIIECKIPKCRSVISPRWEGYKNIKSLLGTGLEVGYRIFMKIIDGLYIITRWRPTLGSGLATSIEVLKRLKYFNENVILEDVDYSIRSSIDNIPIDSYNNYVVKVLVPATYNTLLKQQARWAYGSGELIRKYFKYIIKRPMILLYFYQYMSYPSQLLLAIFLYIVNILNMYIPIVLQYMIVILMIYTALIYSIFCIYEIGIKDFKVVKDSLIAINRVNMAYAVMSPRIFISFILGVLGKPYRWIPTPKIEKIPPLLVRVRLYIIEIFISILLIVLFLLCLLLGNIFQIYVIDPVAFTITYVWGTFRVIQRELT